MRSFQLKGLFMNIDNEKNYTEKELASVLNISQKKLQKDRYRNQGIVFFKLGSSVRYPGRAVLEYIEKNTVQTLN